MLGKSMHKLTATFLLTSLALLGIALAAPQSARAQSSGTDSVADAARRAREAKKDAPAGKKVYTDDDVKPAQTTPPPSQAAPDGAATPGDAPATPAADGDAAKSADPAANAAADKNPPKNDEKTWRGRFKAQRDQIARAEKELDVLQREEDKAQVQYYPDPQKALSEGYTRKDINEKDAKIAAKKDEIAKLKDGLSDLEDQLRKAGGDSGWSRE